MAQGHKSTRRYSFVYECVINRAGLWCWTRGFGSMSSARCILLPRLPTYFALKIKIRKCRWLSLWRTPCNITFSSLQLALQGLCANTMRTNNRHHQDGKFIVREGLAHSKLLFFFSCSRQKVIIFPTWWIISFYNMRLWERLNIKKASSFHETSF